EMDRLMLDDLQGLLAGGGQVGPVALRLHDVAQDLAATDVIVRDQDRVWSGNSGRHAASLNEPFLSCGQAAAHLRKRLHSQAQEAVLQIMYRLLLPCRVPP